MPRPENLKIANLNLDLTNFRTVRQPDETHAIQALIAIHPEYFWGLMESLLEDGYSPTENIIVMENGKVLTVKEGNRRVASLKLILGQIIGVSVPAHIQSQIDALIPEWKKDNSVVPCLVYADAEADIVDRIISRTHGKGEKSGRDNWNAVARARHARDKNNKAEPGLDLLESYISVGKNLTPQQAERWSGEYSITVLDEAIQKLVQLWGLKSAAEVVSLYPTKQRVTLENILFEIGKGDLTFKELRAASPFWGTRFGIQPPSPSNPSSTQAVSFVQAKPASTPAGGTLGPITVPTPKKSTPAAASNDPKSVRKALRSFTVRGKGRDKIVTLMNEIKTLNLVQHPHAFCFLLRSIFELSAKAYCVDHAAAGGPKAKKADGTDRHLIDILKDVVSHLTANNTDKTALKLLHGAISELAKSE